MIIPEGSRYSTWKYVEVADYVEDLNAVIRYTRKISEDERESIFLTWPDEVERFRRRNNNVGIYTSVYRLRKKDVDTPRLSSLYFDLDSEDIDESFRDAKELHRFLSNIVPQDGIRLYFTGSKGFHIEVEAVTLGIDPAYDLHDLFRYIAEDLTSKLKLTTLDMAVYDSRRMWRLPDSIHQRTGLYKSHLPIAALLSTSQRIMEYCEKPRPIELPDPKFDVRANEWYRMYAADYEAELVRQEESLEQRKMEMFGKYGTSLLNRNENFVRSVWKSCLKKLEEPELRNVTLSRQAFRLYLTYLDADKPLEEVTITLQDIGEGIGLPSREVMATLKSAKKAATKKYEQDPLGVRYHGTG